MTPTEYATICTIVDVVFVGAIILATYGVASSIADAVSWLKGYW